MTGLQELLLLPQPFNHKRMRTLLLALLLCTLHVANAFSATDTGNCKLTLHQSSGGWAIFDLLDHPKETLNDVSFDQCMDGARKALLKTWNEEACVDRRTTMSVSNSCAGRAGNDCIDYRHVVAITPGCAERVTVQYTVKSVAFQFSSESEKIKGTIQR